MYRFTCSTVTTMCRLDRSGYTARQGSHQAGCLGRCTSTYLMTAAHRAVGPLEQWGVPAEWPSASTTSTGSTSKGVLQYSLNMAVTVLSTILAFVRSVAVHSMKTSSVCKEICKHQSEAAQLEA